MSRAKRRPTLPNPTSARSARMSADGAQELADEGQRGREVFGIRTEADPKIAVHVEEVARHDEHAVLVAQALRQLERADGMRVADERDRSGLGRHVREPVL